MLAQIDEVLSSGAFKNYSPNDFYEFLRNIKAHADAISFKVDALEAEKARL